MNAQTKSVREFVAEPVDQGPEPLSIGLIGPPAGGKTKSALRVADGIARVRGGDVVVIDTERRAKKYRQSHKFTWVPFDPPFRSEDFLAAIRQWDNEKSACIVIDSMSDEHEGEGGHLAWHDEEVPRSGGNQWAAWSKPSASRRAFKTGFLRIMTPLIFTFRAREKTIQVEKNGKTKIVNIGYQPIAPLEIVHALDLTCILPPHANGVPQWKSDKVGEDFIIKLPEFLQPCIQEGQLTEATGEALARWAMGSAASALAPQLDKIDTLIAAGKHAAQQGTEALRAWFDATPAARTKRFQDTLRRLQEIAREADAKKPAEDEVSFDAADEATGDAAGEVVEPSEAQEDVI
jgi:hypothetical protein